MRMALFAMTMLLVARPAAAECTYRNDYYSPGLDGACGAETMVPAGCPVHVATPSGTAPRFTVYRGAQEVTLPSSASLVDMISVPMDRIDPFDCDCARVAGSAGFDRYEVTVSGAVDGDVLAFEAGSLEYSTGVAFGPPGPCPEPVWPTMFSILTRCDRCGAPPDPSGPGADAGGAGGCSASDDGGTFAPGALGALLGALVVLRRRRAR